MVQAVDPTSNIYGEKEISVKVYKLLQNESKRFKNAQSNALLQIQIHC